jgi:ankyrin repeat protein
MLRRASVLVLCVCALSVYADDRPPGTQFAVAIERHDVEKVKALLAAGNSTETLIEYGDHKITPLMKAAWDGESEIVETLLAAGAKVNAKSSDTDETALMSAVTKGDPAIVNMLIKAGADVTPKNKFSFNVFTSAVAAGNEEIAAILLEAGAKIEEGASGLTPLQFAASAGNINMIRFLVKHGADVNHGVKTGDQTALLSAIYGAHPDVVQALIELKANVNAKTKDGDTPLKAAMKGDQDDIVKLLKAAGAKK